MEKVEKVNRYICGYDKSDYQSSEQIYLDVTYDQQTYNEEMERWQGYSHQWSGKQTKIDNGVLFNEQTYVFRYNSHQYQYITFIQEDNRIVYVFISPGDTEILVPQEYLPKNYLDNEAGDLTKVDGYQYAYENALDIWYE